MRLERIQHPLASQRVKGEARLGLELRGARTRVAALYQQGAAKIRLPDADGAGLEAVLINTAGGMTGGDRLDWRIEAGPDTTAVLTTQACEKVYRTNDGHAGLDVRIDVAAGAHVAWLPQETILFDRSALRRSLQVDLAGDATLLACEATLFGRRAMGEAVRAAAFRDSWRVRRDGRLVHAENMAVVGDVAATLAAAAVAGGAAATATVLLVAPDAGARLQAARAILGDAGAASAWSAPDGRSGKLLARLLADDGYHLRKRLVPLLELLDGQASLPRIWSL